MLEKYASIPTRSRGKDDEDQDKCQPIMSKNNLQWP